MTDEPVEAPETVTVPKAEYALKDAKAKAYDLIRLHEQAGQELTRQNQIIQQIENTPKQGA